jgi:Trypsin
VKTCSLNQISLNSLCCEKNLFDGVLHVSHQVQRESRNYFLIVCTSSFKTTLSFVLVAMISTTSFLILLLISSSCALHFPLDNYVLNTACKTDGGVRGIYMLVGDCIEKDSDVMGFIKSVGAVVCCVGPSGMTRQVGTDLGDKAKRYCEKYGAQVPSILDFHIVEGEKSDVGEFPHIAALGYDSFGEIDYNCGASIISRKFLITAAHCANKRNDQPVVARIGRVSLVGLQFVDPRRPFLIIIKTFADFTKSQ